MKCTRVPFGLQGDGGGFDTRDKEATPVDETLLWRSSKCINVLVYSLVEGDAQHSQPVVASVNDGPSPSSDTLLTWLQLPVDQSSYPRTMPPTSTGYVSSVCIRGSPFDKTIRNLRPGFEWSNIPMLSVLTGKNGAGKTAILDAMLRGMGKALRRQSDGIGIRLTFCPGVAAHRVSMACVPDEIDTTRVGQFAKQASSSAFKLLVDDFFNYFMSLKMGFKYQVKHLDWKDKWDRPDGMIEQASGAVANISFGPDQDLTKQYRAAIEPVIQQMRTVSSASLGSIPTLLDLLKLMCPDPNPSDSNIRNWINQSLADGQFKYELVDSSTDLHGNVRSMFQVRSSMSAVTPAHVREPITREQLTPGEHIHLMALLWKLYATRKQTHHMVLLLDEPDARCHPSLTRELITIIRDVLVKQCGIQVVMTTHRATTASMVPLSSLFIVEDGQIHPAVSKRQVSQLLTADTVYVNDPLRFVFVEAPDDKQWYSAVYQELTRRGLLQTGEHEMQLIIRAHAHAGKGDKCGSLSASVPDRPSSKLHVVELVRTMTDPHAHTDYRPDFAHMLSDFVYGIVDIDDEELDPAPNILAPITRYAIENFILDPIHLGLFLNHKYLKRSPSKLDNVVEWTKSMREFVTSRCDNSWYGDDLWLDINEPEPLNHLLKMKKLDAGQVTILLQSIVDFFAQRFLDAMDHWLTTPKSDKKIQSRVDAMSTRMKSLAREVCEMAGGRWVYHGAPHTIKIHINSSTSVDLAYPALLL